jgi:A/G-specific adenine glycosylase
MSISEKLIKWYEANKRDLPWRNTNDPYKIWLSEIILQQTRVEQGLPYYLHFINTYADVQCLANAPEDQVMRSWQGLGYYSRARNLHFAAKQIVSDYNSEFPNTYNEIIKLKGIGEYTAAAIASFAFKEAKPVLDGNVFRFCARYFGLHHPIDDTKTKKVFYEIINEIIDQNSPDIFNQAIMEFGAMQCKPASPNCNECIFSDSCYAFKENKVADLPIKSKKLKRRTRFFNYLIIETKDQLKPIQKRTAKDIWQNLYEFPVIESAHSLAEPELLEFSSTLNLLTKQAVLLEKSAEIKHILSHQDIFARFWKISDPAFLSQNAGKYLFVKDEELRDFALPRLIELYLEK